MILSNKKEIKTDPRETVRRLVESGRGGEILYIVPTNRKVRNLRKQMLDFSPGGIIVNPRVLTLGTLCTSLFFRGNSEKDVVSEAVSSVLLSQCFRELNPDYFSPYGGTVPRGTLERIRNVINQYKRNGLAPEVISREAESLKGTELLKARAIADIYSLYLKKFSELGVYDIGDIYKELSDFSNDNFRERLTETYGDYELCIVDGFTELTLPESQIIKRIFDISGRPGYIFIDFFDGNKNLFSAADSLIEQLKAIGLYAFEELTEKGRNLFSAEFARGLFNYSSPVRQKSTDKIKIISAVNKREELELIAREIKELNLNNGVIPSDIALVFNLIEEYSELVRDVFSEYGIPLNLTDRYRAEKNPLIISIINLLELSENDFYYKNLFRALSSNILEFDGLTMNDMMVAASELKIVGGIKKWKGALARLKLMPQSSREEFKISQETCIKIEKALDKLQSLLEPLKGQHTYEGFRKEFYKLLGKLNPGKKLLTGNHSEDEKNVKALKVFLKDINAAFSLLEAEYGNERTFSLSYFITQLKTICASSRYNLREKPNYGVLVTTPDEIRGLTFKVLFIGGLFEGNFPTRYSPEIFMAENYRKNEEKHRREEQNLFYQAVCCFSGSLYLSSPSNDEKKKLVRSHFIDECLRIFDIQTIARTKHEGAYYSPDEKQIYTGKLIASGEEAAADPEVAAHIRADNARIHKKEEYLNYRGILGDDFSNKAEEISDKKYFSISALEMYASCPFRYFAERILKLRPVEEPVEKIEPLELGSLLHSILYEFLRDIISSETDYHSYLTEKYDEALERLLSIAKEKISSVYVDESESFFDIEKIFGIGGDESQSILAEFLDYECRSKPFIPLLAEYDFQLEVQSNENTTFKGRIDRIDVDEEDGVFKVIDYKLSGRKPGSSDLKEGLSLQLPIYILAAKRALYELREREYNPVFPEIYSLKQGEVGGTKVSTESLRGFSDYKKSPEVLLEAIRISEEMADSAMKMAMQYIINIQKGNFYLSRLPDRDEKVCKNCDQYMFCRVREEE